MPSLVIRSSPTVGLLLAQGRATYCEQLIVLALAANAL